MPDHIDFTDKNTKKYALLPRNLGDRDSGTYLEGRANRVNPMCALIKNKEKTKWPYHPASIKHVYVVCWTNVEDVGTTLYKCYTNVLCFLGGALLQWLKLPAWKIGDRGFESRFEMDSSREETKYFPPLTRKDAIFESSVWRAVSTHSSHHHEDVLLAQFSLSVHKGGLKPHSFIFGGII